jgi:hypothetical protein
VLPTAFSRPTNSYLAFSLSVYLSPTTITIEMTITITVTTTTIGEGDGGPVHGVGSQECQSQEIHGRTM